MCLKNSFLRFSWILHSVENVLQCTTRKTKFINNGILFDIPLNSHFDIEENLLQPVRSIRLTISAALTELLTEVLCRHTDT